MTISIVRNAVDMSRTPHEIRSASPEPGQHTDEILAELGRDEAEIDELRSKGVV